MVEPTSGPWRMRILGSLAAAAVAARGAALRVPRALCVGRRFFAADSSRRRD
jgi:hypothetical protein